MTHQELLQAVYTRLGGKPDSAPEPLILAKAQDAIKSVTKELVYSGNPMASLLIKRTIQNLYGSHSNTFNSSGVNVTTNEITVASPNNFVPGMMVVFTAHGNRVLPTPISHTKTYFIKSVDALKIKVSETATGAEVDLTNAGSGTGLTVRTMSDLGFQCIDLDLIDTDYLKTSNRLLLVRHIFDGDIHTVEPVNSWDGLETLPALHNKDYYKYDDNKIFFNCQSPPAETTQVLLEHYAYLPITEFPYELVDILLNVLIPMLMPQAPQQEPKKNEGKKKR